MHLILISPEQNRPDEHALLEQCFALGLERFHVRKPHLSAASLADWIERVPEKWRARLVLHQHHELATKFRIGGLHWRDEPSGTRLDPRGLSSTRAAAAYASRSTHDAETLRTCSGIFDAVFFGPVFPSISKSGYAPNPVVVREVRAYLHARTAAERRTAVIALGGITADRIDAARALGFDGVAALGAVWQASDPVAAFVSLQQAVEAMRTSAALDTNPQLAAGVGPA